MTADGKVSKTTAACTKSATSTTSGWLGRESRKIYEETGASQMRTKSSSRGSFPSERFVENANKEDDILKQKNNNYIT